MDTALFSFTCTAFAYLPVGAFFEQSFLFFYSLHEWGILKDAAAPPTLGAEQHYILTLLQHPLGEAGNAVRAYYFSTASYPLTF